MDYGYVPGGTAFDTTASEYFALRPNSTSLMPLDPTIESFVFALTMSGSVIRPVDDLGIGCHGLGIGLLQIKLDAASKRDVTTWDEVDNAVGTHSVEIPSSVLDPRPVLAGFPLPARFRIVGCNVGQAVPFLQRLKTALGGAVLVTATPHVDSLFDSPIGDGILRLLLYEFRVSFPDPVEGHADLVEAFHAKHFKYIDNSAVPRSVWEKLVPTDVYYAQPGETTSQRSVEFNVGPGAHVTVPLPTERYQYLREKVGPIKTPAPTGPVQTGAQRRAFMADLLRNQPTMKSTHPFPLYQRLGYGSFDEFMNGFDWIGKSDDQTQWTGYRESYVIMVPITEPVNSDKIIFDFVGRQGGHKELNLKDTDSRLFTTIL